VIRRRAIIVTIASAALVAFFSGRVSAQNTLEPHSLALEGGSLRGDENGGASSAGDKFSYTAKALHLKQGEKIKLEALIS
jgi:hypothetical protein